MPRLDTAQITDQCDEVGALLASLAHPSRLKILCAILDAKGTAGVTELAQACGMDQPVLSQFLARMSREGLVAGQREGRTVRYQMRDERVVRLLTALHDIFCSPQPRRPAPTRRKP